MLVSLSESSFPRSILAEVYSMPKAKSSQGYTYANQSSKINDNNPQGFLDYYGSLVFSKNLAQHVTDLT